MENLFQRWLVALVSFLLLAVALPVGAEPLRINSGVGAPYFQADRKGFLDLLIPEIFRRIGVEAVATQYIAASERAMMFANSGFDDGVAMRIRGLEKTYPNLIRVDEKVLDNDFVAYASRPLQLAASFQGLRGYEVGHIHGWKIFEAGVPAEVAVTKAKDAEQLFLLLENDRVELILFERWQGNQFIKEHGKRAYMLRPPLASTEMFMYLHKKHAHLVGPAARSLRAMKTDGSYQSIAMQSLPGYGEK